MLNIERDFLVCYRPKPMREVNGVKALLHLGSKFDASLELFPVKRILNGKPINIDKYASNMRCYNVEQMLLK